MSWSGLALVGWLSLIVGAAATESPGRVAEAANSVRLADDSLASLAKASAQARFDAQLALKELHRTQEAIPSREQVYEQYQASGEYRTAVQELRQAQKGLESQRQSVVQRLEGTPAYRQMLEMRDQMQQRLEHVRPVASYETRCYLAERILHYAAQATRMRLEAQQSDPEFQKADLRLTRASQKMQQLRDEFETYYRNDAAVVAAVKTMERAGEQYMKALREATGLEAAYTQALSRQGVRTDWVGRYRYSY